jgi:hypothetical protein
MTATEQLALDIQPIVAPEGKTIQARFESFHERNPWVFRALEKLAQTYLATGNSKVGIGMLYERLRWEYGISTIGSRRRLNNNLRSRYARALVAAHPEWDGVIETRELRAA